VVEEENEECSGCRLFPLMHVRPICGRKQPYGYNLEHTTHHREYYFECLELQLRGEAGDSQSADAKQWPVSEGIGIDGIESVIHCAEGEFIQEDVWMHAVRLTSCFELGIRSSWEVPRSSRS
jgi:hypothetical protein